MATGTAGSSLADELNRIANNMVYPAMTEYKSEQGAANAWAGTSGLGLIAALNRIAEPTRQPDDYKDFNSVCNELAGTTGLAGIPALRTIDL
jgi:hypothetical protein